MTLGTNIRCSMLLLACLGADVGAWSGLADERTTSGPPALDTLVAAGSAWALQAALGWLTVLVALLLVDVARGATRGAGLMTYAGCPPGLRRLLLLLCGVAVVGSLAAPSYAEGPGPGGSGERTTQVPAARIDGLPLPDRADTVRPAPRPVEKHAAPAVPRPETQRESQRETRPVRTEPQEASSAAGTVVVRPGDCLWDLARAALVDAGDPSPSASAVDRTWRALYAANRSAVGADPGLVHPGTVLRLPDTLTEQETDR